TCTNRRKSRPSPRSGSTPTTWSSPRMSTTEGRRRPPASDPAAVLLILRTERAPQRGLLVRHDEQMRGEPEQRRVRGNGGRLVEEGRARQRKPGAEVHGIADHAVGPSDDQPAGRIERRWRALADEREGTDAPQRQRRAGGTQ